MLFSPRFDLICISSFSVRDKRCFVSHYKSFSKNSFCFEMCDADDYAWSRIGFGSKNLFGYFVQQSNQMLNLFLFCSQLSITFNRRFQSTLFFTLYLRILLFLWCVSHSCAFWICRLWKTMINENLPLKIIVCGASFSFHFRHIQTFLWTMWIMNETKLFLQMQTLKRPLCLDLNGPTANYSFWFVLYSALWKIEKK